jgi:hypothetical protein
MTELTSRLKAGYIMHVAWQNQAAGQDCADHGRPSIYLNDSHPFLPCLLDFRVETVRNPILLRADLLGWIKLPRSPKLACTDYTIAIFANLSQETWS